MSVYDFTIKNIKFEDVSLEKFRGKVVLIFNSATKCGYTRQYEGIEELYEKYHEKGLEVIDLPCNQLLNQAPGSNEELAKFWQVTFNTKFETFAKVNVNGDDAIELYKYLKKVKPNDEKPGVRKQKPSLIDKVKGSGIKWNFTKFIIDRNGNVYGRYPSKVEPEELAPVIEKLL